MLTLVLVLLSWCLNGPADSVLAGAAAPATALLPTSTKDSLLQTRVTADPSWGGLTPAWGWGRRRLAEQGTEAVGTSAVTRRVTTQVEGPCDGWACGEQEEDWWRRLERRASMLVKSAEEAIWKAARLETHVRFCLSTKTSCRSVMLPPAYTEVCTSQQLSS